MAKFNITPTAASVPFDNSGTSFLSSTSQDATIENRQQITYDPEFVTTSLNGTTSVSLTNKSLQVFSGTATGHSLVLPNATTLSEGRIFDIWNLSSQSVLIKDFGLNVLTELKANGRTVCLLIDNGTANGTWKLTYTLDNGNVFGTNLYFTSAEPETSTNSTTTFLNKLTLTTPSLPLGNYLCQFQFIWRASNANRSLDVRVQRAGANIMAWNPFTSNTGDRQLLSGFKEQNSISGVQTFTLDFKVNGTGTTVYMQQARMFVWRIG